MSEDTKACPVCGESIKLAAIKCRFCNTDLIAYQATKESESEKTLFSGHPAVIYNFWQWVAVFFTVGIAYIVYWVRSIATNYEITTQRVKIERGIFSKTKENIELFRIDHFELQKPLGMRLLGQSILLLRSSDTNFMTVIMLGIPNLESLADTLRECSLRERTRRQVTTFVQA
jgi:membrane protein YdbS with pleckstrin-like domain